MHTVGTEVPMAHTALSGPHTFEQIRNCQSVSLFTHLQSCKFLPTLREEQSQTLTKGWWGQSYVNTPSFERFCCCCVLTTDEHLQLKNVWTPQCPGDSSGKQLSVCHPQPSSFMGPRWTFLHERCCVIRSSCPVPWSPASTLPAGTERFISPSICPGPPCAHLLLSSLPFFSSSAQSEFHYSLSFQCLTTSTFIHINSEWQSLTICWECWQQIVS